MKALLLILLLSSCKLEQAGQSLLTKIKQKISPQEEIIELKEIPVPQKENLVFKQNPLEKSNLIQDPKIRRLYDSRFVKEVYFVTRLQKVSQENYNKWMNALNQGASREGIYRALVLDNHYYALEKNNYLIKLEDKAYQVGNTIFEKFLGTKLTNPSLNFFTFKRILVEKALILLDEMEPEQSLNWYALFSHHLASQYQEVFRNKTRLKKNKAWHKGWAQKVPFQHLKSEVIVKLHQVLNFYFDDKKTSSK